MSTKSTSVACGVVTKLCRKPDAIETSESTCPFPPALGSNCSDTIEKEEARICKGVFNGLSVEVASKEDMEHLHLQGCYGKSSYSRGAPEAISKENPTSKKKQLTLVKGGVFDGNVLNPQIETMRIQEVLAEIPAETLTLSLEEAFFLSYYRKNVLKIVNHQDEEMHWSEFLAKIEIIQPDFLCHLAAYIHLKSNGWVVKSGFKFGSDFCKLLILFIVKRDRI